jgi:hypothetical protein
MSTPKKPSAAFVAYYEALKAVARVEATQAQEREKVELGWGRLSDRAHAEMNEALAAAEAAFRTMVASPPVECGCVLCRERRELGMP